MLLPEKFTIKMKQLLQEEFDDYIRSFDSPRLYGLRINTLKASVDVLKNTGWKLTSVPWCESGFYYEEGIRPSKHPYYHAGLYYIQEPSAMSSASIIEINEGDFVLDLCAAPGGKSTQLAAKLNNSGLLVSNDISATRCKALLKNIELMGIKNAIVTNETPEKLASKYGDYFDKIIIDAPCSGEGMFRKDPSLAKSWEERAVDYCQLQRDILKYAAQMLKSGGQIAYSTCTFSPEENEGMVSWFLQHNQNFSLVKISDHFGMDQGKPEWLPALDDQLIGCGRIFPHKQKGEGHFVAILKKDFGETQMFHGEPIHVKVAHDEYFTAFEKANLNVKIEGIIYAHNDSLYVLPKANGIRATDGLRIMRCGLHLGDLKTKRFEPSQAFAMSLKKEEVKNYIDFTCDDEFVYRYLKGESFDVEASDGFNLVCVDGFPLGWGKVQNGRLKNKYLASWKME